MIIPPPRTRKNKTPNNSKSKQQYKSRGFLSYLSKEKLELDGDNDDNDWINPSQ
ncbi:13847_t:CDS:2 [Cetraspora pellucida]|uniref:13847_t:CDS:1 n=1 Tax=Cetraspora pellucida TaxID=1433469 RepID=A0ACA9LCP8_9GLOM|nr:13847_t:CDS:2 [Cetraspora pellucida]